MRKQTRSTGSPFRVKVTAIFMVVVLAFVGVIPLAINANTGISVSIDGMRVNFPDTPPQMVDGRVLVPIREVFERLGFNVEWQQETQTAVLSSGQHVMRITIGQNTFTTNGQTYQLDVPAQTIQGRTMVPLRIPLESIGHTLAWDGTTQTVQISTQATHGIAIPIFVNGQLIATQVPVQEVGRNMYLPLLEVMQAIAPTFTFNYEVDDKMHFIRWDNGDRTSHAIIEEGKTYIIMGHQFAHRHHTYNRGAVFAIDGQIVVSPHVFSHLFLNIGVQVQPTANGIHITTTQRPPQIHEPPVIDNQVTFYQLMLAGYEFYDAIAIIEHQIFLEINRIRVREGLTERDWDQNLANAARDFSKDILVNRVRGDGHTGSDGSRPRDRAWAAGWTGGGAAEISLTMNTEGTVEQNVNWWWNSIGHRNVMLTSVGAPRGCMGVGVYFVYRDDGVFDYAGFAAVKFARRTDL
jgi:hypothetical protein